MFSGQGLFGIRRCKTVEEGGNKAACVINSTAALLGDEKAVSDFKSISVSIKVTDHYYQMVF